jgi:hypothetical protein
VVAVNVSANKTARKIMVCFINPIKIRTVPLKKTNHPTPDNGSLKPFPVRRGYFDKD